MNTGSPGRPLDPGEYSFWLADHVSCMNFTMIAEVEGVLGMAPLRHALDRAQARNPLLCSKFAVDAAAVRFASAPGAPISMVDEPGNDWKSAVEREVGRAFAPGEAPLVRALRVETGGVTIVALTFHHSIADGRSGAALLAQVVDDALGLASAAIPSNGIAPPLHACFPQAMRWDGRPAEAKALVERIKATLSRHGPLARWPWLEAPPGPGSTRFERIEFEPEVTAVLLERSRREGTTLHGVIGAAQLLAAFELLPSGQPPAMGLMSPVDLRPSLATPMPPDQSGFGVSMVWTIHPVSPTRDFWALAREIRAELRSAMSDGTAHIYYARQRLERLPPSPEGIALFTRAALATPQVCVLSNIGAVDAFGGGHVRSVSFVLRPMPNQLAFLAASALDGRLVINLAYDAARLPGDVATRMAASIRDRIAAVAA